MIARLDQLYIGSPIMQDIQQYNPLRWPPDLQLAKVHMKCVCPGKDNAQGIECPCCGRFEKIKTKKWYSRNILKDFKNYGGGIPGYFQLLKYCGITLFILSIIVVTFHIYIIQTTCPLIKQRYINSPQQSLRYDCQLFLFVFRICDTKILIDNLNFFGFDGLALAFFVLQMLTYIFLVIATICMKLWLQRVNSKQIVRQQKVYSYFALMIKNIPKYYQIEDLRKDIDQIIPGVQICQLFFVYEIAELQQNFKKLFDLHFQIEYVKDSIAADRGQKLQQLNTLIDQYRVLYSKTQFLKKKIGVNNGRAIIVFNTSTHRDLLYNALKVNECSKFWLHSIKMLRHNPNFNLFADKICQPQQIIWKYVGESSVTKTVVRIKTTLIGFGFMIASFLLLYFPIIKIDQENIKHHSTVTTVLNILISIVLQILAIIYRQIIMKILPSRHPSSRQSESYFIVITTVVFHFLFYIIAPGTYYVVAKIIPSNIKLKQLFVAVITFLVMTCIIAFIDLRYRIFNSRRKKIMSTWTQWGKFCQMKLHQEIRWPSFPIEFKIMVLLNIWSFNAFYVFQLPYLMLLFSLVIVLIYWVDKKNLYRHYKMQVFQSIDLQISVQRDYIIMFLICVSCGYAIGANFDWQYYVIGGIFIISLIANFLISYKVKNQQNQIKKSMTLSQVIKAHTKNQNQELQVLNQLISTELRQNLLIDNASTVSLGSATYQYGYKQIYDTYLTQFKSKHIMHLLQQKFEQYGKPNYNPQKQIMEIRRTTYFEKFSGGIGQNRDSQMNEFPRQSQENYKVQNQSEGQSNQGKQVNIKETNQKQ